MTTPVKGLRELTVIGLLRGVAEGITTHRGCDSGVCERRGGVRLERSDRRALERDRPGAHIRDEPGCEMDLCRLGYK